MNRSLRYLATGAALGLLALLLTATGPPGDETRTSTHSLVNSVISAAGSPGSSTSFQIVGSVGQPTPIGVGGAANATLYAGFWYGYEYLLDPTAVQPPAPLVNRLYPNFPNPFNPSTEIVFTLAAEQSVRLEVFDLQGRRERVLVQQVLPPGRHRVTWDGRDGRGQSLSSGLYFYRLHVDGFSSVRKMLLLK